MPPVAIPPIACASCNGVTVSAPCPMETEIVSPAYHFSRKFRIFHFAGRHRALRPRAADRSRSSIPRPAISAYFAMLSIPMLVAERVEENVTGLRDRFAQIDAAVAAPQMALEIPAIEARAARAAHLEIGSQARPFPVRPTPSVA